MSVRWGAGFQARAHRIWLMVAMTARLSQPGNWLLTAGPYVAGLWLGPHVVSWATVTGLLYFLGPYNLLRAAGRQLLNGDLVPALRWFGIILICNLLPLAYLLMVTNWLVRWCLLATFLMAVLDALPALSFSRFRVGDLIIGSVYSVGPFIVGLTLAAAPRIPLPGLLILWIFGMATTALSSLVPTAANYHSTARWLGLRPTLSLATVLYLFSALVALRYGLWPFLILAGYLITTLSWRHQRGLTPWLSRQLGVGLRHLNWLLGGATLWLLAIHLAPLRPPAIASVVAGVILLGNLLSARLLWFPKREFAPWLAARQLDLISCSCNQIGTFGHPEFGTALKVDLKDTADHMRGDPIMATSVLVATIVLTLAPYWLLIFLPIGSNPLTPFLLLSTVVVQIAVYLASGPRPIWTVVTYPLLQLGECAMLIIAALQTPAVSSPTAMRP